MMMFGMLWISFLSKWTCPNDDGISW